LKSNQQDHKQEARSICQVSPHGTPFGFAYGFPLKLCYYSVVIKSIAGLQSCGDLCGWIASLKLEGNRKKTARPAKLGRKVAFRGWTREKTQDELQTLTFAEEAASVPISSNSSNLFERAIPGGMTAQNAGFQSHFRNEDLAC